MSRGTTAGSLAFGKDSELSLASAGSESSRPIGPELPGGINEKDSDAVFRDWLRTYRDAPSIHVKAAMEATGLALAEDRRAKLAGLIVSDPERALKWALSESERSGLPIGVVNRLEERVSARGRLDVFAVCPEPGKEREVTPVIRRADIGGRIYQAFVYGRRLGEPTRADAPLSGIAVGDLLALQDVPATVEDSGAVAEAGTGTQPSLPTPIRKLDFGSPGWTTGQKRLLLIRVEFSDLLGTPLSDTTASNMVSGASSFYLDMSYGQTSFARIGEGSDTTPTLLMPQTASWYSANNAFQQLRTDARNAASAAGYTLTNYDLDLVCFGPVPGWNWIGLGNIGSAGAWLRGTFTIGVAAHELGHNYGLPHANFWDTQGQSVVGPGTSVEYGDPFDLMGTGYQGDHRNHTNVRFKNYLGWLPSTNVLTATTSGTYRIYAQDDPQANGPRALKINKRYTYLPMPTNYWVEFRQSLTGNNWLMNGAGLRMRNDQLNYPMLFLDTTPGSPGGKDDSAIVIGRTYTDADAWTHITPIGKGGTSPESLDVVVNHGNFFITNLPPSIVLSASETAAVPGSAVAFEVAATDPNGDSLAYDWDFGDGTFGANESVASHSWSAPGDYVVRCRVSDMKGGAASKSVSVVVGSVSTFRISGRVTEAGVPLENVRVFVSGSQMGYTDSDGTYLITGLAAGSYTVQASLYGYTFAAGFANPVLVGPSANGIDFSATALKPKKPWVLSPPQDTNVVASSDAPFSVVAAGTPPLYYQWWFNGAAIPGAQNSSFVRTNAQTPDAGSYFVVVSNAVGAVTSAVASLTITLPVAITNQPQSQLVNLGSDAVFHVGASGTPPLTYQWRFNETNVLAGATESTLVITNATDAHAGAYSVVVNGATSATSETAWLAINHLPLLAPVQLAWLPSLGAKIKIVDLLSSSTDADGDTLALESVAATSDQGGAVAIQEDWIVYTPPAGLTNDDFFAYSVTDGRGGVSPGTVTLVATPDNSVSMNLSIELLQDGSVRLNCSGIPLRPYEVQYTEDTNQPWQTLATVTADEFGSFQYVDTPSPSVPARLYRTKASP